MIPIRRIVPAAAGLALLSFASAPAAPAAEIGDEIYGRINASLTERYLIPHYKDFSEAATRLKKVAEGFCAGTLQIADVRSAYGEAMDAWMGVQHVGFGPAELFMRGYRIQFWPQARGKFGKAVEELLSADDASALSSDSFRNASVAAQGLPAVEELLYAPDAGFAADEGSAVSRCDVLEAVTANVAEIADGLVVDWTDGEQPFGDVLRRPGPENPYFGSAKEATLALFKSFYAGLELIQTAKLRPALGEAAATARPELSESPLSGRSVRNIVLNLRSLQEMYEGSGGAGLAEAVQARGYAALDQLLRKAFRMTIETAESVSLPLAEAVRSAEQRPRLEQLATQVQALKQIVKTRLADALELGVGFNALDGD